MRATSRSSISIFPCSQTPTARSPGPTTRSKTTGRASSARCTLCSGTARSRSRSAVPLPWTRLSRMPSDLRDKVALVTGVGRVGQIGHAVARGFGRAGAQLVIADVNAAGLADRAKEFTAEGFSVHAAAGDLTTPGAALRAVAAARERFGGLDVVVDVAGGG